MKKLKFLLLFLSILGLVWGGSVVIGQLGAGGKAQVVSLTKGLVGHWKLDDTSETIGNDLVTNGDFTSWTSDDPDGWSEYTEDTESVYVTQSGNAARLVTTDGTLEAISQSILTVGKRYRYEITVTNVTTGSIQLTAGIISSTASSTVGTVSSTGTFTYDHTNVDGTNFYIKRTTGATDVTFTDVKVYELQTADSTPYTNHGSLYQDGTYGTDQHGQSNNSMTFSGTDEYVDTGDVEDVGDTFTFAAWVFPDTGSLTSEPFTPIIVRDGDTNGNAVFRVVDSATPAARVLSVRQYGVETISGNSEVPENTWSHVAVSVNNKVATFYLNGAADGGGTFSGSFDDTGNIHIGKYNNPGTPVYWDGNIADARTYNRALSAAEIKLLSDSYRPKLLVDSLNKGLIGHWPLGQESETIGSDLVTNGTFTTWTDPTVPSGWSKAGTHNINNYVEDATNACRLVSDGTSIGIKPTIPIATVGKKYRYYINITDVTSGSIKLHNDGLGTIDSFSTVGIKTGEFVATDENIQILRNAACDVTFTNFRIYEVQTADLTPASNHGTLYQDSTIYTTDQHGQSNMAMEFDGSSDKIPTALTANTVFQNGSTISAWIKPVSLGGTNQGMIFDKAEGVNTENGIRLRINSSTELSFRLTTQGLTFTIPGLDVWQHVLITMDTDALVSAYVNGAFVDSGDLGSVASITAANSFTIGSRADTTDRVFDGSIADVRIYDRVLTATEITKLYNSYQPKVSTGSLEKGLIGHWGLKSENETHGNNIVTNGTFDTDSDWTKQTGWTISGGTADCDGSQTTTSYIYQSNGIIVDKDYRTSFTVSNYSAGTINLRVGNSANDVGIGTTRTANGTYIEDLTGDGGGAILFIQASSDFVGSIDNVQIYELQATGDSTPNTNHGTLYQDATVYDGNGYMEFNGTTDKVDTGADMIGTGDISVSAWIYPETLGEGSYGRIVANGKFEVNFLTNNIIRVINDGVSNNSSADSSTDAITLNAWNHLVVTRTTSAGSTYIYINGTDVNSADRGTQSPVVGDNNVIIGNRLDQTRTFDGLISDVRIYDRVLSADEISLLYNKGR